jgi:glycosyltransferase involved in cell wall biosynthesis
VPLSRTPEVIHSFAAVGSVSRLAGGLFESVRRLSVGLRARHVRVEVLSFRDEFTTEDTQAWHPIEPMTFRTYGPRAWCYSPGFRRGLLDGHFEIGHLHGLWMYPSHAVHCWFRRTRRPFLVSPHGMLDPWALANSAPKKSIAWRLVERRVLREATCIRALNRAELAAVRRVGLDNPVCVIPNGVDLPAPGAPAAPPWKGTAAEGRRVVVHLGRYHPKKNLAALLQGWALMTAQHPALAREWALVLAGWNQKRTMERLQALAASKGLEDYVVMLGPQFGESKRSLLANANAFVLPSLSEGLPVVVLEAWSFGLPVLMSAEANIPEGFEAGAALPTPVDAHGIASALAAFLALSDESRRAMGGNGRRLVEEGYSWERVTDEMVKVYAWLLGKAQRPESVVQ